MNETTYISNTPETDEEAELRGGSLLVRAAFARKLERQRNELLMALRKTCDDFERRGLGMFSIDDQRNLLAAIDDALDTRRDK